MVSIKNIMTWGAASVLALVVLSLGLARHNVKGTYDVKALLSSNVEILDAKDPHDLSRIDGNAANVLKKDPLNSQIFLHKYLQLLELGQPPSIELLTAVKVRNPRNRAAVRGLLQSDLQNENYVSLIEHLDLLYRLNPDDREGLDQAFLAMVMSPESRVAMIEQMNVEREWGKTLLLSLVETADLTTISFVETFVRLYANLYDAEPLIMQRFFAQYVKLGRTKTAYNHWLDYTGSAPGGGEGNLLFNSEFKPDPAPHPFNWRIDGSRKTFLEYLDPSGLSIVYFDSERSVLATQIIEIRGDISQPFQFQFNARVPTSERSGHFEWRVYCHAPRKLLLKYEIIASNEIQSFEFSLPEALTSEGACEFFEVRLYAFPSVYSNQMNVTLRSASLHQ